MNNLQADIELVNRCLKKDQAAQFEFYNRFQTRMFEICLRYAENEAEACDFLQEGFIKAFRGLPQYNGSGALGAWVKRIMVNNCISELRRKNGA